jgi:hypothetical protein
MVGYGVTDRGSVYANDSTPPPNKTLNKRSSFSFL